MKASKSESYVCFKGKHFTLCMSIITFYYGRQYPWNNATPFPTFGIELSLDVYRELFQWIFIIVDFHDNHSEFIPDTITFEFGDSDGHGTEWSVPLGDLYTF